VRRVRLLDVRRVRLLDVRRVRLLDVRRVRLLDVRRVRIVRRGRSSRKGRVCWKLLSTSGLRLDARL
jgi:hypothetical protein